MDLAAIAAIAAPVLGAVAGAYKLLDATVLKKRREYRKRQDERDNDTHLFVSNHLLHAVERIEAKVDRGFADTHARIDRHLEDHI